jgi:hypothetical protein
MEDLTFESLKAKVDGFLAVPENRNMIAGFSAATALATRNPIIIAATLGVEYYLYNKGVLTNPMKDEVE